MRPGSTAASAWLPLSGNSSRRRRRPPRDRDCFMGKRVARSRSAASLLRQVKEGGWRPKMARPCLHGSEQPGARNGFTVSLVTAQRATRLIDQFAESGFALGAWGVRVPAPMRGCRLRLAMLVAVAGLACPTSASALTLRSSFVGSCPTQSSPSGGSYGGVRICSGEVPSFDGTPLDVDVTQPAQNT
jgi:hypothetical protein